MIIKNILDSCTEDIKNKLTLKKNYESDENNSGSNKNDVEIYTMEMLLVKYINYVKLS